MRADDAQGHDGTALVAADPYVAFAKIAALFDPPPPLQPGVHTSAVVDPGARIDPQAQVGPFACIGARSRIAAGVVRSEENTSELQSLLRHHYAVFCWTNTK